MYVMLVLSYQIQYMMPFLSNNYHQEGPKGPLLVVTKGHHIKNSFNNPDKRTATMLSEEMWEEREKGEMFILEWSKIKKPGQEGQINLVVTFVPKKP